MLDLPTFPSETGGSGHNLVGDVTHPADELFDCGDLRKQDLSQHTHFRHLQDDT
jgi:hypothetical protein